MSLASTRVRLLAALSIVLAAGTGSVLAKGGTPAPAPAPVPAPATQSFVLGFDDIGAMTTGVHMPDAYGGFTWGDRWFALYDPNRNQNYLALGSGLSLVIHRADGGVFYFDGADFWSRRGLDAVGDFYFVLYYKGATVYNGLTAKKGKKVFGATPTPIRPDYTGPVDGIAFAFDSNGLDWNHLAMDNFRFRLEPR